MAAGLKLIGKWKRYGGILKAMSSSRGYEPEAKRCLLSSAHLIRSEIVDRIRAGRYAPNRPMTVAIKGSALPLVDKGDLIQGISVQRTGAEVFVGVLRTARAGGKKLANIAEILHEWAGPIKVTPKMRGYFLAMSIREPEKWRPLKATTKALVFSRRRFVGQVVEDAAVIWAVKENFEMIVDALVNQRPGNYRRRM